MTIQPDKLLHAAGSSLALLVSVAVGTDLTTAALVTAGLGIGRELYNLRNTGFSWADLAADVAGIAAGALLATMIAGGGCA